MRRVLAAVAAVAFALALGCSGDDGGDGDAGGVDRPDGPVATVSGPLSDGGGVRLLSAATGNELRGLGWRQREYAVAGTAVSYRAEGELPGDGTFELLEDESADYRTRIVVRLPPEAADFNGTVVVEWFNVTSGFDASPAFTYLADELLRGGYAWVGVSAQRLGVEGGEAALPTPVSEAGGSLPGLRGVDPERYGDLHHPGDAFAYDIYTQVARTLRDPDGVDPLRGLRVERLLAAGASQSAFALTTYANGVQPLARQYDGFLVQSRGAAPAPLGEPGDGFDLVAAVLGSPTTIRTDLDVPVLVLQTETDVVGFFGSASARQPDSERFRLWEVAGTAHADAYLLGEAAALFPCAAPVNAGPLHFVAKAALRQLDGWVRSGEVPPEAPRLEVDATSQESRLVRDGDGVAVGGIRTPLVDAPVDVLSGEPVAGGPVACLLFGSTAPIAPERLAERYGSADAYLAAFTAAADAAVGAGFVLPEDRDALLAAAQPGRLT